MPDVDVVQRSLHPRWRSACRQLLGNQPPELIADSVLKGLADHLRAQGGAPALEEATEVLFRRGVREESISLEDACRAMQRRFGFSPAIAGTIRAAHKLDARVASGRALPGRVALAEQHCWDALETSFFGRLHQFVGPGQKIPDYDSLDSLRAALRRPLGIGIAGIAEDLTRDPTASRLRAPRSTCRRPMTRELLDEPLTSRGES